MRTGSWESRGRACTDAMQFIRYTLPFKVKSIKPVKYILLSMSLRKINQQEKKGLFLLIARNQSSVKSVLCVPTIEYWIISFFIANFICKVFFFCHSLIIIPAKFPGSFKRRVHCYLFDHGLGIRLSIVLATMQLRSNRTDAFDYRLFIYVFAGSLEQFYLTF